MAIKLFQRFFKKHPKGHIGLTAEEAYAPLPEEDITPSSAEPLSISEPADPAREAQAEASAPEKEDCGKESHFVSEDAAPAPSAFPKDEGEKDQKPVCVWMYGFVEEPQSAKALLRTGMISAFRAVSEDMSGFSCRLKPNGVVSVLVCTDPDIVSAQAGYLITRFKNTYLSDRDVQNAVMMQLEVFNAYAEFTLNPPYCADDVRALYAAVYKIAQSVYGYVLNEKTELYRWDARLVISQDGRTDFTEFMPVKRSGSAPSKADQDAADAARRTRSIEILKKHGVDIPAEMPVQIPEAAAVLRSSEDIVNRLIPLFACALKAQAYTSPRDIQAPHAWVSNALKRLNNQYGVNRLFTGKEADYIVRGTEAQHPSFLLRFESCQVLLWALGLINLSWPQETADTEGLLRVIRDADTDMLLKIAKPRPLNMILSMHDVTYRLHSICVRTDEETLKKIGIDHDVVYERHYALNWLLTADGIQDWDTVIPKT